MALIECTSEMDRDDTDHKLSDEELEFLSMLHNTEESWKKKASGWERKESLYSLWDHTDESYM